jgi:hypothetical protein
VVLLATRKRHVGEGGIRYRRKRRARESSTPAPLRACGGALVVGLNTKGWRFCALLQVCPEGVAATRGAALFSYKSGALLISVYISMQPQSSLPFCFAARKGMDRPVFACAVSLMISPIALVLALAVHTETSRSPTLYSRSSRPLRF